MMRSIGMTRLAGAAIITGASLQVSAEPPYPPVDTLPRVATQHFNFVAVHVADMQRALRFYSGALQMHERGRAQPDLQNYEVIMGYDDTPAGTAISLTYRSGISVPRGNGSSSINLVVKNLNEMLERIVSLGGKITTALKRVDGPDVSYSSASILDPDANAFELIEYHRIGGR